MTAVAMKLKVLKRFESKSTMFILYLSTLSLYTSVTRQNGPRHNGPRQNGPRQNGPQQNGS